MKEERPVIKKLDEAMPREENLQEYKHFFEVFSEICAGIISLVDLDKLTAFFVNKITRIFNVNKVSLMLLDEAKSELFIKEARGLNPEAGQVRVKLGELFCGRVAKEGRALVVRDVEAEFPALSRDRATRYTSKSFMITPLQVRGGTIGVLSLTDKKEEGVFTEIDLNMLKLLSNYLALHIENIKLLNRVKGISILDPLTNLFNHRYFHEQLFEEIYRAERYKHPLSLIMLDIDNFSDYNRDHGYSAGDLVLKQIGKMVQANTRQADVVSHYGPEEFMIILPETKLKEASIVGEKIREKISEAIFVEDRKSALGMAKVTVSVGVAEHRVGLSKEELIRHTSSALSEAKQKGKNRLCVFK
jgi:diguanylate cyclase (GGDEF)-like protein